MPRIVWVDEFRIDVTAFDVNHQDLPAGINTLYDQAESSAAVADLAAATA